MTSDQPTGQMSQREKWLGRFLIPNVRAKIILPYVVLTLVVAMIGTYVVTSLVASSLDERLTNQLLEAGRVVSDSLARREIAHVEAARLVAFTRGLADAVAAGDADKVAQLAQPAAAGLNVECLIVTDREGHDLHQVLKQPDGTFRAIKSSYNTASLWLVQNLIRGGNPNALPQRGIGLYPVNHRYYYLTAVPVGVGDQVVGVVIVGTSLDTLVTLFKATAVADVIVYQAGGQVAAATLGLGESEDAQLLESLAISQSAYDATIENVETTEGENRRVNDRWYRLGRAPLRVGRDKVGVFAVALPSNFIISAGATSRNTYALLFTVAMACVVLIGYVIARRITTPIDRLVQASNAVAEGDLTHRTNLSSGDEIGTLATTFDMMAERLEDRTRALEQLLQDYKESAGRIRAILSSIGDGVMLEDTSGQFIPLNAAAHHVMEEMSSGFLFSPLRELAVEKPGSDSQPDINPWLLEHRRFQVGQRVLSVHSAAVRTDDGQHLGNVIVMRDVTAEVEAEKLKDAFVAHVSHELRTPLTAIKGYSQLLIAGPGQSLNDQQRSFVQTISHHTDDLIDMINGLLDFSEMEAKGRLGLQRVLLSFSKLVQDMARQWQSHMDDKGIAFEVGLPADECEVHADAKRLRWAVMNLVRNAWQYTPEGGLVRLQLAQQNGQAVLDVTDTGIGILPQDQQRLFGRFFRASNIAEDETRGLGLGLYVTRAIVEAHGGSVRVVSQVGRGSTFSLILPARSTPPDDRATGK